MTIKEELLKQQKELELQLAEMKKKIELIEEEDRGFWVPKHGEKYWYLNAKGDICTTMYVTHTDDNIIQYNGAFKTEAEAYKEKSLRYLQFKLRKAAKGYKFVLRHQNWVISSIDGTLTAYIAMTTYHPNSVYFMSKADALVALNSLTEYERSLMEGI